MKLTKFIIKRIIAEELLPEGIVRISPDIDADFRGSDMVQLISSTGRLPLDKKSMRVMLSLDMFLTTLMRIPYHLLHKRKNYQL